MNKNIKSIRLTYSKISLLIIFTIIITWIIFGFLSFEVDLRYQDEYLIVYLGFVVVSGIYILYSLTHRVDIFEPIPFITIIYLMFFSISPMLDLLTNDVYFFGHNVVEGTTKATFLYVIGYISFFIGYTIIKSSYKESKKVKNKIASKKRVMSINIMIWIVGFVSSIVLLISYGQSFLYILTIGNLGIVENFQANSSYNFLGVFSYTMVVPWMYININSRSKFLKIILTIITLSIFYLRGFRFIILIMLIAPIFYYYLKRRQRPNITKIIILLTCFVILIGLIGFARGDVRTGNDVNWSEFNIERVWYGLESNFGIYKAFYKMVEVIPQSYDYTFGKQISYTLIILIPRFVWSSKPDTPLREVLKEVLGDYAVKAGTAWPNFGEYYSEFGVIGIIFFMFLFGLLVSKLKRLYMTSNLNSHKLIAYSIYFPSILQLIIRGYTPTNFWFIVFISIPILINWQIGEPKSVEEGIKKFQER